MTERLPGTPPTPDGMPAPDGGVPIAPGTPEKPGAPGGAGPEGGQPGPAGAEPAGPEGTIPLPAVNGAETRDKAAGYTNAELLHWKFPVRRAIQETGTQSVKAWQSVGAKLRNATEAPGKYWKQYAAHRAQKGLDKKQARLDAAKSSSERVINHRQEKVNEAKTLLEKRTTAYTDHKARMEKRVTDVGEHATDRREKYIKELKHRRGQALARKAVRKQLREEGASRRETRAIMGEIPEKHLKRIGKVALVAETSRRMRAQAERGANKAERKHDRTVRKISSAETRLEGHTQNAELAGRTAEHLRTVELPIAESHAAKLSAQLEAMDPDEPAYSGLSLRLQSAEQLVDGLNRRLVQSEWAAAHSQDRAETTQDKLTGLNERRSNRADAMEAGKERLQEREAITTAHQGDLAHGVTVALNPSIKKKGK